MLLQKARVSNFKIVEDSNEFKVDQATCLIGKNESGKTAILEALYRLNPYDTTVAEFDIIEEYPRRYLPGTSRIGVTCPPAFVHARIRRVPVPPCPV